MWKKVRLIGATGAKRLEPWNRNINRKIFNSRHKVLMLFLFQMSSTCFIVSDTLILFICVVPRFSVPFRFQVKLDELGKMFVLVAVAAEMQSFILKLWLESDCLPQ